MWGQKAKPLGSQLSGTMLLDERIRLERYHISTGSISVTVGAVIVYTLLPGSMASHVWFAVQLLLGVIWFLFLGLYSRKPGRFRAWWPFISPLASSLRGFSWGVGWIVFVGVDRTDYSLLYIILFAGVLGGGMNATAFSRSAMFSFGVSCTLPVLWGAVLVPDTFHIWTAVAAVIYTLILLRLTLNVNAFLIDALERREREVSLAKRLEMANQEKSRFFAAASHDLRQPLQAIHFFQYAIGKYIHGQQGHEIFDKLQLATESLTELLNALLDISRLDAGGIDIKQKPFLAHDLLYGIYQRYFQLADEAGISLEYVPVHAWIASDSRQLERIVQNFVVNAIKHMGRPGRVVLGARRRGGMLCIEVHDNGVGIEEAAQKKIFDEFYQLNNPERNRQKGLGLGLSIVKRVAALLGHEIGVHSWLGRGSLFSVTVPLVPCVELPVLESAQKETPEAVQPEGKILLVEDDETVLRSLEMLFRLWGMSSVTATELDAVRIFQQHPDIKMIISDYQLQDGCDGLRLIQQLREISQRNIPAVLMTGNTSASVLETIRASGISLSYKPINPRTLREQVRQCLTQ